MSFLAQSRSVNVSGGNFEAREGNITTNVTLHVNPRQEVTSIQTEASDPTRMHNVLQASLPGHVIYHDQLLSKGRGHPLWSPQPNMFCSNEYRAQGVDIGDVGLMTDDGAFDFLFNMCLPADHPINDSDVPAGFTPLSPPLQPSRDMYQSLAYTGGNFLASSSVNRFQNDNLNGDLIFETSASAGAILTMPDDTYKKDLRNLGRIIDHIGTHAQSWYQFVNGSGDRGRMAQNGDLCIVVGCDKSTSWGIATIGNVSGQARSRLQFRATGEHRSRREYTWDHSGPAEVRVGPGRDENRGLDGHGDNGSGPLRNQCLFLRVVKVKLEDNLWDISNEPPGVSTRIESFTRHAPPTDRVPRVGSGGSIIQPSRIPRPVRPSGAKHESLPTLTKVSYAASDALSIADMMNDYLLREAPEAMMTVSRDWEWFAKFFPEGFSLNHAGLIDNVLLYNDICLTKSGVAYFQPKEGVEVQPPVECTVIRSNPLVTLVGSEALGLTDNPLNRSHLPSAYTGAHRPPSYPDTSRFLPTVRASSTSSVESLLTNAHSFSGLPSSSNSLMNSSIPFGPPHQLAGPSSNRPASTSGSGLGPYAHWNGSLTVPSFSHSNGYNTSQSSFEDEHTVTHQQATFKPPDIMPLDAQAAYHMQALLAVTSRQVEEAKAREVQQQKQYYNSSGGEDGLLHPPSALTPSPHGKSRAHKPLDINVANISSHAQAEALVHRARQDELDLAGARVLSPKASSGGTPSARLAAYGESLALERKLREQKLAERSNWKDKVHDPMRNTASEAPFPSETVWPVLVTPRQRSKSRERMERQLGLEHRSPLRPIKIRNDPRRPSTPEGVLSWRQQDSFSNKRPPSHQPPHSTSVSHPFTAVVRDDSNVQLLNQSDTLDDARQDPSLTPQTAVPRSRTPNNLPEDSLSRISLTDGADTGTGSGLNLHRRVTTSPKLSSTRKSAKKLAKLGVPVAEQAAAASRSTPPSPPTSRVFRAIKSMQSFKGKT